MADSWIRVGSVACGLDAQRMNDLVEQVLERRAASVTKDPELRRMIGTEFVNIVTPYVPKKTGRLRASGRATTDGRVYWTAINPETGINYAYDQYTIHYKHYTTPDTGPKWTNYAAPDGPKRQDFIEAITPIIIERFDEDNG